MSTELPMPPVPALRVVETSTRSHFATVLACSLVLHGLLYFGLHGSERAPLPRRAEPVRVTVQAAPLKRVEPVETAPTPAEPALPREAPVVARAKRKEQTRQPEPVVSKPLETAPAPASEPVDFTGVTLTSTSGGAGWASVTGNGQAGTGPLSAPPRGTRAGSGHGSTSAQGLGGEGSGPPVVSLASLSRPPRAPRLDDALLHNYPKPAREQGQPGHAVVRARIMPDGRVDKMQVLVASAPEFGRACQRTLSGSRWSAPLDERGKPVATDVSYTCQFEVTR
jgi:TonB family protein